MRGSSFWSFWIFGGMATESDVAAISSRPATICYLGRGGVLKYGNVYLSIRYSAMATALVAIHGV